MEEGGGMVHLKSVYFVPQVTHGQLSKKLSEPCAEGQKGTCPAAGGLSSRLLDLGSPSNDAAPCLGSQVWSCSSRASLHLRGGRHKWRLLKDDAHPPQHAALSERVPFGSWS